MSSKIITHVCQIAELYGRELGLAPFEIERVVNSRDGGRDEWIIHVQFNDTDPLVESDDLEAIIVVDAVTVTPRLVTGL